MTKVSEAMIEIPVRFQSEGHQLVGMLHEPAKSMGKGIVMCHGFTGNKAESRRLFVEAARAFTNVGFTALRFDFYGSGDSEGDSSDTTVGHNIANLVDAVEFLRQHECERLCVLGVSLGGATAIFALHERPADGLVTWSTVPDFKELFEARAPKEVRDNPDVESYEHNGWLLKREFWQDALNRDIQGVFAELKMPKLIVQGDKDDPIFVKGFHTLQMKCFPPADFYMIPGAGHMFETVEHRKRLIRITLRWLRRNL